MTVAARDFDRTKRRVIRLSKFWKDRLLPQWRIDYVFHREPLKANGVATDHKMESVMTIERSWTYKRAQVNVAVPSIVLERLTDDDIEEHLVHEMCHALIHQMRSIVPPKCANCGSDRTCADGDMEHEEAVVTNMAIAIVGLRRANARLH